MEGIYGLLNMDGETLNQIRALSEPSADAKRQARDMALMQAGFGMLMNNQGRSSGQALGNALGAGGMAGIGAYQDGIENARRQKAQEVQTGMALNRALQEQRQRQIQQEAISRMSPEDQQAIAAGVPYQEIWKNRNQAFNLGPGEKRFQGSTVVAEGGQKVPDGMEVGPDGQLRFIPAYLQGKKDIAASGRSQTNVFNNTKDDFKNERDLRNDFSGLPTTKAFKEVQMAHDQIKVSLAKQSPAGDLAAATKIMKILDPGSVVRESELGMAMQASGLMDRVTNYADKVISGTKLTPAQRKDFDELAGQLYNAAAGRYNTSVDEYQGVAKDYNLNPERVAKKASSMSSGGWSAVRKDK